MSEKRRRLPDLEVLSKRMGRSVDEEPSSPAKSAIKPGTPKNVTPHTPVKQESTTARRTWPQVEAEPATSPENLARFEGPDDYGRDVKASDEDRARAERSEGRARPSPERRRIVKQFDDSPPPPPQPRIRRR